jgi:large subunit ribosomal protein L9
VIVKVNVARSPEEADLQAEGVDVTTQMFERDSTAFTEEFEPGLEPGIPAAPENPGTPEEAEVGITDEQA